MKYTLAEVKKAVYTTAVFAVTLVTTVLAVGPDLIPDAALPWIVVGLGVANSYGVFALRNLGSKGFDPTQSVATKEPNPVVD